jgi:hypothetical protein
MANFIRSGLVYANLQIRFCKLPDTDVCKINHSNKIIIQFLYLSDSQQREAYNRRALKVHIKARTRTRLKFRTRK